MTTPTRFVQDDGGRAAAGYRGTTGDCATRAAAIATGLPYQEVYDAINQAAQVERPRRGGRRSNARTGVHGRTLRRYLEGLGWRWTPTMAIGTGTTTHLRADELPAGPLVAFCSRHFVAVVDGTIHDLDPDVDRDGTRAVYGYLQPPEPQPYRRRLATLSAAYRHDYEAGWRYSGTETASLDHADAIGASDAWQDGYHDRASQGPGRDKWHLAFCRLDGGCPEHRW